MKLCLLQIAYALLVFLSFKASAETLYVSLNNTNPVPPYTNWSTAATNIQDAVDASTNGDLILVTNGIYATGGRTVNGYSLTNRVVIDKAVTVQSVNGPATTVIQGNPVLGNSAVRCVLMITNATLAGFTLKDGATRTAFGINFSDNYGGGVCGFGIGIATVSNCVLTGNIAVEAGGACDATLICCTLTGNSAPGNGAGGGEGGGAFYCTLIDCNIANNTASDGGGAESCSLINCTVVSNTAFFWGGGVSSAGSPYPESVLTNCTIVGNTATNRGGGTYSSILNNCIIYGNYCPSGSTPNVYGGTLNYCWTNDPLFANPAVGNYHLQPYSPCINSGNNAAVTTDTDLDGNPRIVGGTVDIGAYEYQTPVSKISYAWLQQYGLPITTNTDTADQDGDSMNNYQEWIAGTDPTNPLSLLEMLNPVPTNEPAGWVLSWESVSNRTYFLQSSTNLGAQPAFSIIQSNIVGQPDMTSYMDTNAIGDGPFFYRVGVQQ